MSTIPFDPKHVAILNEIFPGMAAAPESLKRIDQAVAYEPELVAIVNTKDVAGISAGSILECDDGTTFWVSQETRELDHYVIWITHNVDRGACGFHLPSTAGPRGLAAEKALGNVKQLAPGGDVTLRYACGFRDKLEEAPVRGAR